MEKIQEKNIDDVFDECIRSLDKLKELGEKRVEALKEAGEALERAGKLFGDMSKKLNEIVEEGKKAFE